MARKSMSTIQKAFNEMVGEHQADKTLISKLKDHSIRMIDAFEQKREEKLLVLDAEYSDHKDDINKIFDYLIEEEKQRLLVLQRHLNNISGGQESKPKEQLEESKPKSKKAIAKKFNFN